MALERKVRSLVKDMLDMKRNTATDVKQIQDEIYLLKSENLALKEDLKDQSNKRKLLSGIPSNRSSESLSTGVTAFSAYVSNGETKIYKDHTIKFDSIVSNIGDHYNEFSGIFTAPQHGVYVFTWNLYCSGVSSYIFSQLVVNADVVGAMYTDAAGANYTRTTTGVVVVEINSGDVVFVRVHPTRGPNLNLLSDPDWRSTFSGWKLY